MGKKSTNGEKKLKYFPQKHCFFLLETVNFLENVKLEWSWRKVFMKIFFDKFAIKRSSVCHLAPIMLQSYCAEMVSFYKFMDRWEKHLVFYQEINTAVLMENFTAFVCGITEDFV